MLNAKETSLAEETPGVQNIYFGVHGLYLHMVARCLYSLPYTFSQSVLEKRTMDLLSAAAPQVFALVFLFCAMKAQKLCCFENVSQQQHS